MMRMGLEAVTAGCAGSATKKWRPTALAAAAATAAVLIPAGVAHAGTVGITGKIQGAGQIVNHAGGPYDCSATSNQDDRVTFTCTRQAFEAPFESVVQIRPQPASTPAGHWRFVRWEGCDALHDHAVYGVKSICEVRSGAFNLVERTPKVIYDDHVAPTVSVGGPGYPFERAADFSITTNEGALQCALDDFEFAACGPTKRYEALAEGSHTFRARAVDPSGNASAIVERSFRIVDTAIETAPDALVATRTATFAFSTGAGTSYECIVKAEGTADPVWSVCPASHTHEVTSDGVWELKVRARDGSYVDPVPATHTWTVDTTDPVTSFTSGPNDGEIRQSTAAELAFAANEPAARFECRLDRAAAGFEPCTSPHRLESLTAGDHTFEVRAIDTAGNTGDPASRTWTVAPDADRDGFPVQTDCDDARADIHPGAADSPDNGIDENCDGSDAVNLDRDGDGVLAPADCDDANPAIGPGRSDVPGNGVDEDCAGGDAAAAVTGSVRAVWSFSRRHTVFKRLRVERLPAGATIEVRCRSESKGCRFRRRTVTPAGAAASLSRLVRKRRLRVGAVVEVRILKSATVGKVVRYTVRRNRAPKVTTLCLPPGAAAPSAC